MRPGIWWMIAAIGLVFIVGMFFQARYQLFSVYSTTRTCDSWVSTEQLKGNLEESVTPFCWNKDGSQKRWVTELNDTVSGCQITYKLGCDISGLTCEIGEKEYYTCPDGKLIDWCNCVNSTFACIISPESQCPQTTCNDYCPTLAHAMCTGWWNMTGDFFPDCKCEWICDIEQQTNYLPYILIGGVVILLYIVSRKK